MNQKKSKGQTTVELMLLLSVSVMALGIIYVLYTNQADSMIFSNNSLAAKDSVRKLIDSANKTYYSGRGSQSSVYIDVPSDVNLLASYIDGRQIVFTFSNGTQIFGVADANILGSFKSNSGKYFVYLYYDGNVVHLSHNEYELNKQSAFVSITQGSQYEDSFTIRNNATEEITFVLESTFSHSDVSLSIDESEFTLSPAEIKIVSLTLDTSETAYGNYAGNVLIKGELNDVNIEKYFFVSVESYLEINSLTIYPRSTSITTESSSDFSICNSTTSNISNISWEKSDSEEWITALPEISSVDALSCTGFTLNYSLGSGQQDTNITANYSGGSYTAFISFDS